MQTYLRFGVYKMVRDFVVAHCTEQGCRVDSHVMDAEEQLAESSRKIFEEATEVTQATTPDETLKELADLADAMDKFMRVRGITAEALLEARIRKQTAKGVFDENIYLSEMDVPVEHKDIATFRAAPDKYLELGQFTENDLPPSSNRTSKAA